ncbi:MAG: GDSL-type esterase/lipase family protein [Planctomycetaceae bacterium]
MQSHRLILLCVATLFSPQLQSAPPQGEPTNQHDAAFKSGPQEPDLDAEYNAWVGSLPPQQQAWERVLQENLGSFYLPIHKREKVAGRSNAWDYVDDAPGLPRVLLIGDSVSRGYTQTVRRMLAEKATVHRAPANCGPTSLGIKNIDIWLGDGQWDVIHFNFGIHDRTTPIAEYTHRLRQLVTRMQSTGAKLVWASTTPIPDVPAKQQTAAAIVERNAAAAELMHDHRVMINDLFTAMTPHLEVLQNPGDVHFSPAGYDFLGAQVATSIKTALSLRDAQTTDPVARVEPWNLDRLKQAVPEMKWVRRDQPVHSLTYVGEEFRGQPTEVFAFYASPTTLGANEAGTRFPGIVLIHGGGGTAFADWAHRWAKRGYAAIAMDLAGARPPDPVFDDASGAPIGHQHDAKQRQRLSNGGPDQGHAEKFDSIGDDTSDDWPFYAVASVIRAHTLLRSFAEVDANRTAVTGISWGGYTTCLVASLDDRFKAAVPVYGCGFLHEGESVQKPSIDRLGDRRDDWVNRYDPSRLLARCQVPMFFVNGTNDKHYPLDSFMKSFALVRSPKQLRVVVDMPHSHPAGWAPDEIGLFIDSHCRNGVPLPVPETPWVGQGTISVRCSSQTKLKAAELHYTTENGVRSERSWQSVPAAIDGLNISASEPPAEANTWFLTITDERDAVVSTTIQFRP